METNAEKLTLDELIKINSDVITNFKRGSKTLLVKRIADNPISGVNYAQDYDVQDLAKDLILGIIDATCNSAPQGIGILEITKSIYIKDHLRI